MRIATLAALAISLLASPQVTRFKTGVEVVRVDVLAVDSRSLIAGLVADDFEVIDSGVVQSVDAIALTDVPISLMVALDLGPQRDGLTLEQLKKGVITALTSLEPRDRAALLTFSSDLRLLSDWTGNAGAVAEDVAHLGAGGGTSLVDAVFAALTFGDPVAGVRRLTLVFSDGADTSSWLPRDAVIDKAQRTDTVLYAVTMRNSTAGQRPGMMYFRSGIELSSKNRPSWTDTPFSRRRGGSDRRTRLRSHRGKRAEGCLQPHPHGIPHAIRAHLHTEGRRSKRMASPRGQAQEPQRAGDRTPGLCPVNRAGEKASRY